MTDKNIEPHELILDMLRAIRTEISGVNRRLDALQSDVLNVRKDIHKVSGELLRQEEAIAGLSLQVNRINTRLGLTETPQ